MANCDVICLGAILVFCILCADLPPRRARRDLGTSLLLLAYIAWRAAALVAEQLLSKGSILAFWVLVAGEF